MLKPKKSTSSTHYFLTLNSDYSNDIRLVGPFKSKVAARRYAIKRNWLDENGENFDYGWTVNIVALEGPEP